MDKFTPYEIKIIDFVNKEFSGIYPTKQSVIKWIKDTLGYTNEEAQHVYALWFLNKDTKSAVKVGDNEFGDNKYRIPWETIENVNRGDALYKFVERLKEKDGDEDEVLEVYYPSDEHNKLVKTLLGGDFHYCDRNGYVKTPCINFERDGLEIAGDSNDFEQFISGAGDQAWRVGDDGSGQEDYDNEEFNYVMYNDKTLDLVKRIGDIVGVYIDDPRYGGMDNDGGLYTYLTEFLTEEDKEDVINEYLWALNGETGRYRSEQVTEYYEDEVTYVPYKSEYSYGPYTIKIPYEDLLEKIKEHGLFTFSDLQDLEEELNPCDCDLDDAYWGGDFIDESGAKYVKEVLNAELERKLHKLEDDENYAEKIILKKEFEEFLKKSGFTHHSWMKKWSSGDGKLQFLDKDLDFDEKMITFTYNGEKHKTSLEDFTPWVQGSVLDLNECVTVSKFRLIMETVGDPLDINKIAIFDFDGTLMDTPHAEEGKREWEEKTGSPYPHRGWWSKRESLDTEVFDIQPIKSTISDYVIESDTPNTYMVMLTGRLPNQKDQVEDILHSNDIVFDEYHYKDDGDTLTSKLNTIVSLLNRFPNTELIEMYEDREPHAIAFQEWGRENGINIKVNLVTKPQLDFK